MKRLLTFDEDGFLIPELEEIVDDSHEIQPNQYLAELQENIAFYKPKLVDGEIVEGITQEELDEINSLVPEPTAQEMLEAQVLQNKFDILSLQLGV